MISPELLRRYTWFGSLNDEALKSLAMLADRRSIPPGQTIFSAGDSAAALYLIISGTVDLYDVMANGHWPNGHPEAFLSEVGPGEVFGISAFIEPYRYTLTARSATEVDMVSLEAAGIRALLLTDASLAQNLLRQMTKTLAGRLYDTRVLLAAARA